MQMMGGIVPYKRMVQAAATRWLKNVFQIEAGNIQKEALTLEIIGITKWKDQKLLKK